MSAFSDNLRGAIFMIAAMAGFALEDMCLKAAAAVGMPVGQIMMLFGAGGTLGFALIARVRREAVLERRMLHPMMLARGAAESGGRLFYTLAIALAPLSTVSAILQATPLVVVAAAALLLGETVGRRRWLAILAGFVGVLMILRPGLSGFDANAIFALLGMLGFAGRDLATRAAPKGLTNAQLGVCGFSVLVPTGAALLAASGKPASADPVALGLVGLGTLIGVAAYTALTAAMRTGAVSVVTPFRYSRLIFGVALGILAFGERPDGMTLLGSAVILAAGLYILLHDRRPSRA